MEETLLSAARRVVRFFNIDMNKGGLITEETQQAIEQLDFQVRRETERQKRNDNGVHSST
jgi:hypothetical protein